MCPLLAPGEARLWVGLVLEMLDTASSARELLSISFTVGGGGGVRELASYILLPLWTAEEVGIFGPVLQACLFSNTKWFLPPHGTIGVITTILPFPLAVKTEL